MTPTRLVPEAELHDKLERLGFMLNGDGTAETRFWCLRDDSGIVIQVPLPHNGMYEAELVELLEVHIAQYLADQSSS
jgi:hypothetical protein